MLESLNRIGDWVFLRNDDEVEYSAHAFNGEHVLSLGAVGHPDTLEEYIR